MKFDSAATFEEYLHTQNVRHHKLAVVDVDGVLRGKYLGRDKLSHALHGGLGFCDVVFGWDSADALYEDGKLSGWHTAFRDARVELDLSTVRLMPEEESTVLVLGKFTGEYAGACPRSLLERVVARAEFMGLHARAGFEYEFFVFDETPDSVRAKGYRDLRPFTPGMFGYSVLRSSVHADLYRELLEQMAAFEAPIEGLHTETGPGVIEAALEPSPILEAADRAALFKTFSKVFFQRRGLMATFMAKWSNAFPGQSGHLHLSLSDPNGESVFQGESSGFSPTFESFVAGQVTLLPEVLAMVASTVNSYRRLVPGIWAPTHANWGYDNRTTAVRAVAGGTPGARSEYRIGAADGNPHLVAAAALATGLYGIEHGLRLPPVAGNAYVHRGPESLPMPSSLSEAARALAASKVARELFGDAFIDHYAATREWEARAAARHVSDFELARYFEII
jgi:glutamine synthetase